MHVAGIEPLRVFEATPNYLCNCKDLEMLFSQGLAMPVFGRLGIVSQPTAMTLSPSTLPLKPGAGGASVEA